MASSIASGTDPAMRRREARLRFRQRASQPLRVLLDKVATKSARVTRCGLAAAMEAGFTDDQLFELVICAAVGPATRRYNAGLGGLAEATADAEST